MFLIFLKKIFSGHIWDIFGLKYCTKTFGPQHRRQGWLVSFFFMSYCWVNAWGFFHHNLKDFNFRSYFWAKVWSKTFERIWEGLDCLIFFLYFLIDWVNPWWCFFKFPLISWIFLFLGDFWAPHTQKLVRNLPGAPQKVWVVQFLSAFLIHVKSFQTKFIWSFALILFDFFGNISQK